MVDISIHEGAVHIEVKGLDKLWAFRSQLDIPLAHIAGVKVDATEETEVWRGLRALGTYIPGVISAGSFYQNGKWVFWDVHNAASALVIHLHDERFDRLIVEVQDAAASARLIEEAVASLPK